MAFTKARLIFIWHGRANTGTGSNSRPDLPGWRRNALKQAVMKAPGIIEIRDVEEPTPGPGEVLLKVQRIGICGSDVHVYHGSHPFTTYPVVQGHEYSASIEALGEGVSGLYPHMKVTSLPQIGCGECRPCQRGDYHICDNLKVEGFQAPGCAQELWLTEAEKIVPLPDAFSYEEGALVEPLAVAVHAVKQAPPPQGKNVLVLGAGTIGNLVAQTVQAEGGNVLITDISDHRLSIARQCGLHNALNPRVERLDRALDALFGRDRYEIAFECAGVEATITDAIANIAKGGTVVVVGVFGNHPRINLGFVQDRELHIVGSLMYKREDYERAIDLISRGKVLTQPLISKHFSFEEYLDAYKYIEEQGDRTMKVFIDVAETSSPEEQYMKGGQR
jgi:2-desacetyl-2-hydroxyethyl bacteriochlorophyllide A dehydrogenase